MAFVQDDFQPEEEGGRWVPVASYGVVYQADFARATLECAGIPAQVLGGDHVAIFGPGWAGLTLRELTLLVPAECYEEARELLGYDEDDADSAECA
jgi:hypothetical protein